MPPCTELVVAATLVAVMSTTTSTDRPAVGRDGDGVEVGMAIHLLGPHEAARDDPLLAARLFRRAAS